MDDPKLSELTSHLRFRDRVRATLQTLKDYGLDPIIYEGKRSLAEQRKKVSQGRSKTLESFHVKRGPDAGSLAADIASEKDGWNVQRRFWFVLGASCRARGLGWGGLFNLSAEEREALLTAIDVLRIAKFPEKHDAYSVKIGWDPAHVQTKSNWI
ncbi:MAG TPA: hypothetical protein PKA27_02355 [Fimbriimonadaceae bacterium]|nr:hypothetical protein [Fimbriimonadaceae bacterium]